jgi:hypothetical protein
MNKRLLHLAILAMAFLTGRCGLLTAQSGDIKRSDPDPVAEGMAKAKAYKFRSVDYSDSGFGSAVYDFNGKTAVGECFLTFSTSTAFTFHGNSYVALNVPGAISSAAIGINTSGQIVGEYYEFIRSRSRIPLRRQSLHDRRLSRGFGYGCL